ncbi:uncharacterized protein EV154DRAFT_68450 [Mucor mucedo]|uniref:uncharacterized protein n=1 Tax=Mucor mucedo TaxID=29922 RepID=UPI00221FD91F|nr:uncharacterized protein EV154DRAFT_68450 [Mucor mucedo]KAI7876156.1 hypothetical protein EV154DRAFT_68450 [Mucor mucedo]
MSRTMNRAIQNTKLSILYHTSSGVIIATGIEADESWKSDKYHNDTYVPNILTELYGSYLSKKRQDYPNTLQDEVIMQEFIRVLQNCLEQKKRYFKIPSWEFHYVFTLPTIWDVEMRDEIRSLFFKAGLVQEHDHPDRLLLITELESRVRYIQSTDLGFPGTQLDNGRQYTMYALDFDEEVLIQMEIFSAHYPPTSIDSKRIPRLLEMSQFTIPYQIEKRVYIEACLEERYNIMLSPDLLNLLTNESDVPWDAKEKQRYHDPTVTKFHVDAMHIPFQKYFAYKPFKGLRDLYKGEYNLDTSEIKVIELITIGDIYTDLSDIIKAIFLQQMDPMFQDTSKGTEKIISTETKVKVSPKVNTIMFPCTENFSQSSDRQILLKFLEKWSEEYDEQQGLSLMKKQIKSANKFRDPKVISASAEKRSFDFYYSPSYFINVDITLTTVNFLILYEEEGNFDIIETEIEQCGIRSFDNFIVHSSLHERPLIKITKR